MDLNIKDYAELWKQFKPFCHKHSGKDMQYLVTWFSIGTMCPLIVSCYFYFKTTGQLQAIDMAERVKKFYNYNEIKGLEEFLHEDTTD